MPLLSELMSDPILLAESVKRIIKPTKFRTYGGEKGPDIRELGSRPIKELSSEEIEALVDDLIMMEG